MGLKLGDGLEVFINKKVATRRLRRWVIGAAFICLILGIGLGLTWSLASKRNHDVNNYCEKWNSATHKMERVVE